MRALVIDDSRATRSCIKRMLSAIGFEVEEAAHGGEGLESLRTSPAFDVVFVDWNMPEMNGIEFLETVRADPDLPKVTTLMVSSVTDIEQMTTALDAGADDYLMKPFNAESLLDKLDLIGVLGPKR